MNLISLKLVVFSTLLLPFNLRGVVKMFAFKVEEIVENGEIPVEDVHLPGVYVKGVLKGSQYQKRIEVS